MDKQGKNEFNGKDEQKVIDLSEVDVKEAYSEDEDIDTLYEKNETADKDSAVEPTMIFPKSKSGDKNSGDKKKKVKSPEKPEKKEKQEKKEKAREERLKEKNEKKLEKLMKKKKKREDHSDREVLSYEDMPLEERENTPHKKPKKSGAKRIVIVALLLVIVAAVVFVFAGSDKYSWHNIRNYIKYGILNQDSDKSFPISVQGENVDIGNLALMGQDICFASDTKMQIVNNYGRPEYSTQHGFTNPIMKASDKYALICSLGGTGFEINDFETTLFTGDAEERILTADINDHGEYALVTTSNGYLSKLQVYNKENERIFGYSFADYYVTSVSLAPNGKSAAVTGLSALNGSEISCLYVLDFTKDKPLYQEEVSNNIFYDCEFLDDTYACAIGNAAVAAINIKNGDFKSMEFEGKSLTCYCVNRDTKTFSVSLSRSGDGRNCQIVSFRSDGTVTDSFDTEFKVKYISSYKGRIALLTSDALYLYSKDGGKVSEVEVTNEPRAAVLYTSSDAYVLDTNEINVMSI